MGNQLNDVLYLEVTQSNLMRKNILETAIVSAKILKHYELFNLLRQKDSAVVQELNQSFKNLRGSFNLLAGVKLPAVKEIEQVIRSEYEAFREEKYKPSLGKIKLDQELAIKRSKLDQEIEEIEEKLKRLGF